MSLWSAADAAQATGGIAQGDWIADGVSIDTRTLQPGDLFVALKDVRDGHDFVAQALEKGAAAALVSRIPDGLANDAPLLIVPDVLAALVALGVAARARTNARVVAVTGSVGKTSTKEMLRVVLDKQGRTHAAEASYNNHWGVPLTLARMPADTEFAIIELGMNHPGEIGPLARLARPHVAMITTVAPAHLEAFDDIEGIAREKAAIFEGLVPGGVAVVNGDLDTSALLEHAAGAHTCLTFGAKDANSHRLTSLNLTEDATIVQAALAQGNQLFKIACPGRHFAMNALGVLAVVDALDGDVTLAARDLALWQPPAGRGTMESVVFDAVEGRELTLYDDAFNANPASMAAALEVLGAATPGARLAGTGRRIAILGDMLELGEDAPRMHAALVKLEWMRDIDVVHCVGPLMHDLWAVLEVDQQGRWFKSAPEMAACIQTLVGPGDVVLVKGSKGIKISLVVDELRKLGHRLGTQTRGIE